MPKDRWPHWLQSIAILAGPATYLLFEICRCNWHRDPELLRAYVQYVFGLLTIVGIEAIAFTIIYALTLIVRNPERATYRFAIVTMLVLFVYIFLGLPVIHTSYDSCASVLFNTLWAWEACALVGFLMRRKVRGHYAGVAQRSPEIRNPQSEIRN